MLERMTSEFPAEVTTEVHTKGDRMTLEYRRILADLATRADRCAPTPLGRGFAWARSVIPGTARGHADRRPARRISKRALCG